MGLKSSENRSESNSLEGKKAADMFRIEHSTSNLLTFYRTPTEYTSRVLNPSIAVIKEQPFLMVPSIHSYSIFNLQDLTLRFLSCNFDRIDCILQSNVFVYVLSRGTIYKTYRGEVFSKYEVNSLIDSNSDTEMLKFGTYFLVKQGNRILVYETADNAAPGDLLDQAGTEEQDVKEDGAFIKILYTLEYSSPISKIFHPKAYLNKILIIFDDGTAELYNLNSEKTIFKFNFGFQVTAIQQTSIVDVIGLGQADGMITFFNIKKNKSLFTIPKFKGSHIRELDFSADHMLVVREKKPDFPATESGSMPVSQNTNDEENTEISLFDLKTKKEIFKRKKVSSGAFINDSMFLVLTRSSIEIVTLDDFKVLKSRQILNSGIRSISKYSETELILENELKVFKMNIYRDEANCFLKVPHRTSNISVEENIVAYGQGRLSYIDKNGKFCKVLDLQCNFIRTFKDFCLIGKKSKVVIINLKSKRVVLAMNSENVLGGDLDCDSFTLLTPSGIYTYDYSTALVSSYEFTSSLDENGENKATTPEEYKDIRLIGNLYFLQLEKKIQIISHGTCREFPGSRYSLDLSVRIMATVLGPEIFIFDIASGNIIDRIRANKSFIDVCIMDNFKFLVLLDDESNLHILSNASYFNAIHNFYATVKNDRKLFQPINVTKKSSNLYKDILIYKENSDSKLDPDLLLKSLSKPQITELVQIVKKNLETDFYNTQPILNKILKYKIKYVDQSDLKLLLEIMSGKLKEYEDKVLKTLGYLRISNHKSI